VGGAVAVVFLYQIAVFLQQKNTTASLLELYFNDSMQTVCTCGGGGGGGSQQREVADGADVVGLFTDTVNLILSVVATILTLVSCNVRNTT